MKILKTYVSLLLVAMLAVMLVADCITAFAEETQDAEAYYRASVECYNNGDYEAALENTQKAAELGNIKAWFNMGIFYANGIAVKQDYQSALLWYQKAADAGHAMATNNIGVLYAKGYVGEGPDPEKAAIYYRKAAELGNSVGMNNLGVYYRDGDGGLKQDYTTAFLWFQRAADLGFNKAQYNIGECYEYGRGVAQNQDKAIEWYQKAAENGIVDAQTKLGKIYESRQEYEKAAYWFQEAADDLIPEARYKLGRLYEKGLGVEQSDKEAAKWVLAAADGGYTEAMYCLGVYYWTGRGFEKTYAGAERWFQEAAAKGHGESMYWLGVIYRDGLNNVQDYQEALSWFGKALEAGSTSDAAKAIQELVDAGYVSAMNYDAQSPANETQGGMQSGQTQYSMQGSQQSSKSAKITLMVYMCGSNLEDIEYPGASTDIREMAFSNFNTDAVNLIIMAGGSEEWELEQIQNGTTGIYQIGSGTIRTLQNDGRAYNMGDPETLRSFLEFSYSEFPAEKFALILWDHGGGSTGGICHDEIFKDDALDMTELNAALQASPFGRRQLDWIGFDACLMSAAETAKIVAPYAKYMIASEEMEPGFGWDYSFLSEIDRDSNPTDTGDRIIKLYDKVCREFANATSIENFTMACIDLSKISGVADAVERFFRTIEISRGNFAQLSRTRGEVVSYGRRKGEEASDSDIVDLGDLVSRYIPYGDSRAAAEVANAINDCVKAASATKGGTGLTVYFPFNNKNMASKRVRTHAQLGFSDSYDHFIETFSTAMFTNGQNLTTSQTSQSSQPAQIYSTSINSTWNSISTLYNELNKDKRSLFVLPLNEQQLAEIRLASIVAIQQTPGTETWHLVATQEMQDWEIEKNKALSGEYIHTNLFVTDGNGVLLENCQGPLLYTERDDGLYVVMVTLVDEQQNRTDAELVCSRDRKTDLVTVQAVYPYDAAIDGYSPRMMRDLSQYQTVIYQIPERKKTYVDSVLLAFEDWEEVNSGDNEYSWNLDEPWQLAFLEDKLDTSTIQIAFQITDIYNNVYLSEPVSLLREAPAADQHVLEYDDKDLILIPEGNVAITAASGNKGARISLSLENITDGELIVTAEHVRINGQDVDATAKVYGTGTNDSLKPQESQTLTLRLPAEISGGMEEICFDLTVSKADGEEIDVIEVRILPATGATEE